MTSIVTPERTVDNKGKIKVEAEDNAMLLMDHGNGCFRMCNAALIILILMVMKERARKDLLYNLGNTWKYGAGGL